jgi:hypothetical protein
MRLGVIYDSQATNKKQGVLPVSPLPLAALLLFAWESYMTLSRPEYTKTPSKKVEALTFLLNIRLKQHFFTINL